MDFVFLFQQLLDLIYERNCINCGCSIKQGVLCKTCSKLVQNMPPFTQGKINGYTLFCGYVYGGIVKEIIHRLKFKHHKACAYVCAEYLFDFLQKIKENNQEINFQNAIIVPVPTHKKNRNKRGYDNVVEICKKLSLISGYRLNSKALKKIKYTTAQFNLNKKQRLNNPKGSFSLDENFKPQELVILVDDICTTGATLSVITSLFKQNGIKNLICLTFAKTVYHKK